MFLTRITAGTPFSINSQLYCINHTLTSEYNKYVWRSWLVHKAHVCQPQYPWMRITAGTPFLFNSQLSCIDHTFTSEYNWYTWWSWLVHTVCFLYSMVYINDFADMTLIIQVHMTSMIHRYGDTTEEYRSRYSFNKHAYIQLMRTRWKYVQRWMTNNQFRQWYQRQRSCILIQWLLA